MARFEHLMDRRPLLLSRYVIKVTLSVHKHAFLREKVSFVWKFSPPWLNSIFLMDIFYSFSVIIIHNSLVFLFFEHHVHFFSHSLAFSVLLLGKIN